MRVFWRPVLGILGYLTARVKPNGVVPIINGKVLWRLRLWIVQLAAFAEL